MPERDCGRGRAHGRLHWLPKTAVRPPLSPFGRILVDVPRLAGQTTRRERFSRPPGGGIGSLVGHQGPFSLTGGSRSVPSSGFYSNRCVEDCENASNSWDTYMEGI